MTVEFKHGDIVKPVIRNAEGQTVRMFVVSQFEGYVFCTYLDNQMRVRTANLPKDMLVRG